MTLSKHAYKYCSLVCTRSSHSQSHILFAGLPQEASVRPLILADSIHLLKEKKKKEKRSGIGSPDWHVSMFDIHPRRLLWMYCPGHAAGKGNGRADRLAGKITFTSGLRIGRYEVLRSLRPLPSSRGHHTIDRLQERSVYSIQSLTCKGHL